MAHDCTAPQHHVHDAAGFVAAVERACNERGLRLTPIRARVLGLVADAGQPIKAYDLLDRIRIDKSGDGEGAGAAAPPTVYRALDFLMENGLVHRIESRNSFLACAHDHDETSMVAFLICDHCGSVGEIPAAPVAQSLNAAARATGFAPKLSVVEIAGTCAHCQK